ncbi:tryptophan synthase beta subunit-like PLP-dependent enzyme [Xylariales sp. AK1849]|nr:tryptophan synthase beta subunit-like PLP-dependent enzyme [Xylariales sp. AK1849]
MLVPCLANVLSIPSRCHCEPSWPGIAVSARLLKIPATIVMPEGTPSIKHQNVSRLGGTVLLHGADFDAAKEECSRLEKQHDLINIPPFDDPYVIAGQGTIGMELLDQVPDLEKLDAIFCCVGGGGLIAGIGVYVKRLAPHVKIIGVEAEDANAMVQSLQQGKRVVLKEVGLFADGAAVKTVGEESFRICQEVVDDVVLVNTDETCAAIKDVFEDTRSIVEPAGALSLAGLKKWVKNNPSSDPNRSVIAITSGANMNFDRLRFVAERATLGEGKEALLTVSIPERPGAFSELINNIVPHVVTEFSYRYATREVANVLVGISLTGPASQRVSELRTLMDRINSSGMTMTDLSGDELAKTHIRYLVGGRSDVADERMYMFNFPERPGALQKFLSTLRPRYNISLFQYRNGGSDVGKILAGIQCPDEEVPELERFLKEIGYPWEDCTQSAVFKTFLRV